MSVFRIPNNSLRLNNGLDFRVLIEYGFLPRKENLLCLPKYLPYMIYHCDTGFFDVKGNLFLLPKKYKKVLLELISKNIIVGVDYFGKEKKL